MNDFKISQEDFDLQIIDGDFVVSDAQEQHLQLLLITERGQWQENDFVGVGIVNILLDEGDFSELKQEIRSQIELDGAEVELIDLENNEIIARYN